LKNPESDSKELVGFLLYSGGVVEDHDIGILKNQEIDQREIVGFLLYSGGVVEDHDIGILTLWKIQHIQIFVLCSQNKYKKTMYIHFLHTFHWGGFVPQWRSS